MIDSGLLGRKVFFNHHIFTVVSGAQTLRSHEERRWLFEKSTQSCISPSIVYEEKMFQRVPFIADVRAADHLPKP